MEKKWKKKKRSKGSTENGAKRLQPNMNSPFPLQLPVGLPFQQDLRNAK